VHLPTDIYCDVLDGMPPRRLKLHRVWTPDYNKFLSQSGGAPTMVLGKKPQMEYDDDEGMYCRDICQGWISHPEDAKHIAFSGNLLHGAPRHMSRDNSYRVTFLVNIWLNYSPVGLGPLPQQHVSCLSKFQSTKALLDLPQPISKTGKISVSLSRL